MNLRVLLASATILAATPFLASAASNEGFYLGLGGGYNLLHDGDVDGAGINTEASYDGGWAGLGSVGYEFGNGFRTELEIGYRSNDFDDIGGVNTDGDATSWTFMVNALYDFDTGTNFTPYVGVGAGAAWINLEDVRTAGGRVMDDDDTVFALQGIVGASYKLSPEFSLFADYRYLSAINPEFTTVAGTDVDVDYDNSTFLVGLRYSFGAPAAAAPAPRPTPVASTATPAPRATSPSSYLVFFDFDKSDLTEEAKRIIRTAVENSEGGTVRFEITGHADRSGSDAYNLRLSQRRADSVKRFLTTLGVKGSEIATVARGESDPLVPTEDGVKEPQNRRAEIVYK